jgi:ketosteroid isomerase-like protein
MTDPKIKTVQIMYEAFGRGDIGLILDQLTDDVDWASCPDSQVAPWHGIHRGKAEVPGFFKALADNLQVTEFTSLTFAANDTDVLVVTRWSATSPATGKSATMDIHHWWRFRDGKVCFYRGTEDTAQTQDLLSKD